MYKKCEKCKYKQYQGKNIFPCTKCDKNKNDVPITCEDCRYAFVSGRCKKGLRPCKNFKWS